MLLVVPLVENIPSRSIAKGVEQLFIEYGRKVGEISNEINSINPKAKHYPDRIKKAIEYLKKEYKELDFLWNTR